MVAGWIALCGVAVILRVRRERAAALVRAAAAAAAAAAVADSRQVGHATMEAKGTAAVDSQLVLAAEVAIGEAELQPLSDSLQSCKEESGLSSQS